MSITRSRRVVAVTAAAAALAAVALVATAGRSPTTDPSTSADRSPAVAATPAGPLTFSVDDRLRPSVEAVDALDGHAEARPVGVLAGPDGATAELVLDEVIVHARDDAHLDAFLHRWNGDVLDSFPPDDDGQDHLVRVDTNRAEVGELAADLLAVEPDHSGRHTASDERVLRLLALAAAEWRAGTEAVIDWLVEPTGIEDGELFEAPDITQDGTRKNVFDWSFLRGGGALDIGVAPAWQLLDAHGALDERVRYMVVDGGFTANPDFPDVVTLRKADWGDTNPKDCTGGTPCPYHGTDVVLAGMGALGNDYGTAGPAGPVAELIAVGNSLDYWSVLRRSEKMAEQYHPGVVNMSFTRDVRYGRSHAKTWTDRRMDHIQDTGALVVAAAGNNGRSVDGDTLWVPCESKHVLCVGGMDSGAARAAGSNYGEGDSPTSVEIYGPMCVRTVADPSNAFHDLATRRVCGTSVAAPFVGGVAALVRAADPTLGPKAVRAVLNETAHVGGLGGEVTGSQRRVNALGAVARALGVDVADPAVSIAAPSHGDHVGINDWVDLRGTATDFLGRSLPIHWSSDLDGALGEGSNTTVLPLSPGTHVLTASVTDSAHRSATASVTVDVVDTPPDVAVVSPPAGLSVLSGTGVALVATSLDPDTWSPVADADTRWEVRRDGAVVHEATGHQAELPASKVTAGSYQVRFTAAGATVTREFTAVDPPPGQTPPKAQITAPAAAVNGFPHTISFAGKGTDAEDGAVPGTRYRWVAYGEQEMLVLCEGSAVPQDAVPQDGIGGLSAATDCAAFDAELGLETSALHTTWTVWLEVHDSTGLVGTDSVQVTIKPVPVG